MRAQRTLWSRVLQMVLPLLLLPGLVNALPKQNFRQPAYISNAYFSDKMAQKGELAQPLSVIKALQLQSNGVLGYFMLDLILTESGTHHFKVDILNQDGDHSAEMVFPPVQVQKSDDLPMYTAAGTIAGSLGPGLCFFKVYDRLDKGPWEMLGVFGILITPSGK
ncbi:MAG: hypothetical protein HQL94_07415 [Magnetococcales bacterium]|nr:hypothetical protein [Magnetococcales bacterium]MBF0439523.1 hypothetical protein [Magnetococcales bacterium]